MSCTIISDSPCAVINFHLVRIKVYNNQRVVFFRDIDDVHRKPEGTASRNFEKNKDHFIEGEDFFTLELTTDEIRRQFGAFKSDGEKITLMTKRGYCKLTSFTDNLDWKVWCEFVNNYFDVEKIEPPVIELTII